MASKQWEQAYELLKPKIAELKALIESIDWTGIGIIAVIGKIWMAAQRAIVIVEEVVAIVGPLTGQEKEDLAVQVADDAVKLPFYAELVDGPAFRIIIKIIVKWFNAKMGATASGVSFLHAGPVTV